MSAVLAPGVWGQCSNVDVRLTPVSGPTGVPVGASGLLDFGTENVPDDGQQYSVTINPGPSWTIVWTPALYPPSTPTGQILLAMVASSDVATPRDKWTITVNFPTALTSGTGNTLTYSDAWAVRNMLAQGASWRTVTSGNSFTTQRITNCSGGRCRATFRVRLGGTVSGISHSTTGEYTGTFSVNAKCTPG